MENMSYINAYDPEGKSEKVCKNCGLCLQQCPVMQMNKEEAVAEKMRLQNGEATLRVHNECTFCYGCNHFCPHNLKPFALILERLAEKLIKSGKGIPSYLQYWYPNDGNESIFSDVYSKIPEKEKSILDKWENLPPNSREVLFIGCVGRELPAFIDNSVVLKDLPKYAPQIACCGDLPFRHGDFKSFSKIAERTFKLLEKVNTELLICDCGGCTNTFLNTWSNYLNIKLPFEITSIWEWLWGKVKRGEIEVQRKSNLRVALTDSCYSSELGDTFFEAVRGLHDIVGIKIIELKNNRYKNLSCGTASIARNHLDFSHPLVVADKKMKQVLDTGATDLACYCNGCFRMMMDGCKNSGLNLHYSIEKILWSLGDEHTTQFEQRLPIEKQLFMEKIAEFYT